MVSWKKMMFSAAGGGAGWVSHLTQTNYEYLNQLGTFAVDDNGYAYQNLYNAGASGVNGFLAWSPDGDLDNAQDVSTGYSGHTSNGISAQKGNDGYIYLYGSIQTSATAKYSSMHVVNPATRQYLYSKSGISTGSGGSPNIVVAWQGVVDQYGKMSTSLQRQLNSINYNGVYNEVVNRTTMPPTAFAGLSTKLYKMGAKPGYIAQQGRTTYPYGDRIWVEGRGGYGNKRFIGRVSSGGSGTSPGPSQFYENFTNGSIVYNGQCRLGVDSSDNCYSPVEYGAQGVGYSKFAPSGDTGITFVQSKQYAFSEFGSAHQSQSAVYDSDTGYIFFSGNVNLASPLSGYVLYVYAVDTSGNYQGGCYLRLLGNNLFSPGGVAEVHGDSIYLGGYGKFNGGAYNQSLMAKIPKDFSQQGQTGSTNNVDFQLTNMSTPTVTTPSGGSITAGASGQTYGSGEVGQYVLAPTLSLSYTTKSI
jgi:hypothetical protein